MAAIAAAAAYGLAVFLVLDHFVDYQTYDNRQNAAYDCRCHEINLPFNRLALQLN